MTKTTSDDIGTIDSLLIKYLQYLSRLFTVKGITDCGVKYVSTEYSPVPKADDAPKSSGRGYLFLKILINSQSTQWSFGSEAGLSSKSHQKSEVLSQYR